MPDSACAKHARPGFPSIRFPAAAIQICMQINSAISLAFLRRICIFHAAALGVALNEARLRRGWVRHCLGDGYSGSWPGGPAGPVPGLPAAVTLM